MTEKTFDFPKGDSSGIHVVITVPSTKNINQKIPIKEFNRRIRDTVKFLRQTLRGSTRVMGIGNYKSDEINQSVTERVAKVESYTSRKDYNKFDEIIEAWINKKKKEWSQESIGYTYNGKFFLI